MRALQVTRLAPEMAGVALADVAEPAARAGEILVEVEAASLNYPDLLMTRGEYQHKPELPFVLGGDFAGTVIEGSSEFPEGSRVWGLARSAFAGRVAAQQATLGHLPEGVDFATGAAFPTAYLTAYVALAIRARVQPGEWVLVHGASGGMGLAAVDLAKALGARVIAASTSDAKLTRIAELYEVDATVNVIGGFREKVLTLTGGKGAAVIFDPVNGDVFDESQRCVAFEGRLLVIGFTSGEQRALRSNIALIKGFSLMGVRAGEYGRRFPERQPAIMSALSELIASGKVRPHVDSRFALSDWRAAFARMETRAMTGKIVLDMG